MKNSVLAPGPSPAARRSLDRALADKQAAYMDEIERIVAAAYVVAARTGSVDPKVTDIIAEAGLSNAAFYRHFASKDELLLAVIEDGRHRLVGYLAHRMSAAESAEERIEVWIRGLLAQAVDAASAERTRPFAVNADRIAHRFPDAHRESVAALTDLVRAEVDAAAATGDLAHDAAEFGPEFLYTSAMGTLINHLIAATTPTPAEVDALVVFGLRGLGATRCEVAR